MGANSTVAELITRVHGIIGTLTPHRVATTVLSIGDQTTTTGNAHPSHLAGMIATHTISGMITAMEQDGVVLIRAAQDVVEALRAPEALLLVALDPSHHRLVPQHHAHAHALAMPPGLCHRSGRLLSARGRVHRQILAASVEAAHLASPVLAHQGI